MNFLARVLAFNPGTIRSRNPFNRQVIRIRDSVNKGLKSSESEVNNLQKKN